MKSNYLIIKVEQCEHCKGAGKIQPPVFDDYRRAIEAAIMALPQNTGCQLVWDFYEGTTHRVRMVCNGVSAYSGVGTSRDEALIDLIRSMRLEATFDHPDNPHARWGIIYYGEGSQAKLSMIGWGYVWEIKGIRGVRQ